VNAYAQIAFTWVKCPRATARFGEEPLTFGSVRFGAVRFGSDRIAIECEERCGMATLEAIGELQAALLPPAEVSA
jgi:hypothetical protein